VSITDTRSDDLLLAGVAPRDAAGDVDGDIAEAAPIAAAAAATGLSTHTLRYYERAGLMLTEVDRGSARRRRYSSADIGWVRFLTKLRATAMPIARIRDYADLVRAGDSTQAQRLDLLRRHRADVVAQLDEMTRSLAAIDHKIAIYEEATGDYAC
jgi:DNA-binding transcriptional MerR regulator